MGATATMTTARSKPKRTTPKRATAARTTPKRATAARTNTESKVKAGGPSTSTIKHAADTYKLLGEPTRLYILNMLHHAGEMNVGMICEKLNQSQPAVSHHLALLRASGVVSDRRQGKSNFYSLADPAMSTYVDNLEALAGMKIH